MRAIFLFGLLMGARHALEADHVAAVASLATRSPSLGRTLRVAALWGTGHTLTLVVFGALLLGLDASLSDDASLVLEALAGAMLVVLGADVLRRLRRKGVHFHVHDHGDGIRHVHAHAHSREEPHVSSRHEHEHARGLLRRALFVGSVHGLAGSAALTLASAEAMRSSGLALAYLLVFGIGSIGGMMALAAVIAVPFRLSAGHLHRASRALEATVGAVSIVLGVWVAIRSMTGGAELLP